MFHLDLTNLTEEQRGDVSQKLHELQDECGDIKRIGKRVIGEVLTGPYIDATPEGYENLTCNILREEGYDVSVYHGCGHCLQNMPNTDGRCDCECHGKA